MHEPSSISADLTSLLSKLEAEITHDTRERDALTKRIEKNEKLRAAMRNALGVSSAASGYGSKADAVRDAIQTILTTRFTQDDVERAMLRANPALVIDRHHLRSALWSMANKQGFLRYVEKGNNRQPAIFERANKPVNGSATPEPQRRGLSIATNNGILSAETLEAFVREKNRRFDELTKHFGADAGTVRSFFEPASRVYEATRGWIKLREGAE